MRILVLNPEYPPLCGASSRMNAELFEAFSTYPNITFDCITASATNAYQETRPFPNVTIYHLPVNRSSELLHTMRLHHFLQYVRVAIPFAKERLQQQHYDLIHAYSTLPAGFVAYVLKAHAPYFISLQGDEMTDHHSFTQSFPGRARPLRPLMRLIWKKASCVIANSEQLGHLARRVSPTLAVPVIPNGIDTNHFFPAAVEPFPQKRFTIVCVARNVAGKNIHLLLESIAALRNQYKHIHVEIVGDGKEHHELVRIAERFNLLDRVHFHGIVAYDALPEIYRNAHVFILPARNDGFSNTALEAMASGLPIILTDTGSGKHLVSGNGLLVSPNHSAELTQAIKQMVVNTQLRHAFRRASRANAMNYSWGVAAEHYKELYERIIKQQNVLSSSL